MWHRPLAANAAHRCAGDSELLTRYREDDGAPVIDITENGTSDHTSVVEAGQVHDDHRIRYLHHDLAELEQAIAAGQDVRAYFV